MLKLIQEIRRRRARGDTMRPLWQMAVLFALYLPVKLSFAIIRFNQTVSDWGVEPFGCDEE